MLKPTLRLIAVLLVVGTLARLAFGEPLDRRYFVGFAGGAVALILVMVFLMPLLAPHVVSNREFFAAMGRHARRRRVLTLVLAAVTLGAAVFLCTAHLKMHGHYHCALSLAQPGSCDPFNSYWVVGRYAWQIPLAVVVGAVGFAAAVAVLRRT